VAVEFDADLIQSDSFRIRRPARGDEKIGAFDDSFAATVLCVDTDLLAGTALYLKDRSSEQHVYFFVVKEIQKSGANVRIFATCELRFGFDHGHLRSEPAHCLRQFKADVASTDHDEVTRQTVEIERLDMAHRIRRG